MKKLILSLAATSLFVCFNVQATNTTNTEDKAKKAKADEIQFQKDMWTLVGAGVFIGGMEKFGRDIDLPTIIRSTSHVSTLLFTAGMLSRKNIWKEKALKFPLAVMTLTVTATDLVQDGTKLIPYFGEALAKMPREYLVGLETLVFYLNGTDVLYTLAKPQIDKFFGWQND